VQDAVSDSLCRLRYRSLNRQDQIDGAKVGRIILAGNSLSQPVRNEDDRKPVSFGLGPGSVHELIILPVKSMPQKRYGYDSSTYTAHPTSTLDALLTDLLTAGLPVHIVPGPEDPVGSTLPQQPFPRSMLRNAAMGGGKALTMETNPCWFEFGGKRCVGNEHARVDDERSRSCVSCHTASWGLEDRHWTTFTSTCLRMTACRWHEERLNGDTSLRPHQIRCVSTGVRSRYKPHHS
jgi:hypothetical protein